MKIRETILNDKNILITGGTGSFGKTFVPLTLAIIIQKKLSFTHAMR